MRTRAAVMIGLCGLTSARAWGLVNTELVWQLSLDNTTYATYSQASPLVGIPGGLVYARAVVSHIPGSNGTVTPIGIGSIVFQPTVSNYRNDDVLQPFVNNGVGGNVSNPLGVVTDDNGFGRLSPYGRNATTATNPLRGVVQASGATTYLRISLASATSFIGGPGNTLGGSGVTIAQLSDIGRTLADPPFSPAITNVVVFRFAVRLSTEAARPVMVFDAPADGIGNYNTTTQERLAHYFGSPLEPTGQVRGTVRVTPAYLVVPAPGGTGLVAAGGMLAARRRRRGMLVLV